MGPSLDRLAEVCDILKVAKVGLDHVVTSHEFHCVPPIIRQMAILPLLLSLASRILLGSSSACASEADCIHASECRIAGDELAQDLVYCQIRRGADE